MIFPGRPAKNLIRCSGLLAEIVQVPTYPGPQHAARGMAPAAVKTQQDPVRFVECTAPFCDLIRAISC